MLDGTVGKARKGNLGKLSTDLTWVVVGGHLPDLSRGKTAETYPKFHPTEKVKPPLIVYQWAFGYTNVEFDAT
ncbi:hypothetical protein M7I_7754 [Glarea lozoyensis 74030]|uniref:Uncharacterized protein n=1 Tax=Glarea lozoyensis (strain ATCC 74030 / MF5533) TaxID=1104152 RepID=H0EY57_GLAL7|nr:hypothetical protein M7I_7754 [Glarea lozoyensis 74030]